MAPNKSTIKKPPKAMPKPIEKPISKTKKNKKKSFQNFSIYLYKLLRSVTANQQDKMGISRKSMLIMNNFVYDTLEKIATEAGRLVAQSKKTTLSSREVQTAVKLLIPGELAKHANMEALKAVTMYHNSQDKD